MVEVKICGITRFEDVDYLNELKPEYAGFVFAESKRQITKEAAKMLIDRLDKNIKKVGVFVDEEIEKVKEIAEYCDLDIIQLHGNESTEYSAAFKQIIWKAVRVADEKSLEDIKKYQPQVILLDTYKKDQVGGTGSAFDWNIAKNIGEKYFVVLAGGLSLGNVISAIETVKPQIVDTSSGVETDGIKDFTKIKIFIEKVREYNEYR